MELKENTQEFSVSEDSRKEELTYIFGPCSAESEDQVFTIAKAISKIYPKAIFRSGIWKPRTRPNNFEGVGKNGLPWLNKVQKELGIKVATEVANTRHVELCLNAGIDALWLGARTTVNPFYVQEIAESLRGCNVPIYIKNPVSPDLNLWIGAIERLEQVGVKEITAIHRGFQAYESKPYRNAPQWEIPIALMANRPDIKLICDISHIGGEPSLFPGIAQKALDLNFNGLHIEVHNQPKDALSDAKQQITPIELSELLKNLRYRQSNIDDPDYHGLLKKLRSEIDQIDEALIQSFTKRFNTIQKIGLLKKENQITILQVERWKEIKERYISEGLKLGISIDFLEGFLTHLHDESMRNQDDIMNI